MSYPGLAGESEQLRKHVRPLQRVPREAEDQEEGKRGSHRSHSLLTSDLPPTTHRKSAPAVPNRPSCCDELSRRLLLGPAPFYTVAADSALLAARRGEKTTVPDRSVKAGQKQDTFRTLTLL